MGCLSQLPVFSRWQLSRALAVLVCSGLTWACTTIAEAEADPKSLKKAGSEIPEDVKRIREYLAKIDLLEPSHDLQHAVSAGDYRPIAVQGYSVSVPGIRLRQLRCLPNKGRDGKVVPGTSDFIGDSEHAYLINLANGYASRYNQLLFERLKNENKLRIAPIPESHLESLELPKFVTKAGLKEALAHLREEALKYHPEAEVPEFRVEQGTNESAVAALDLKETNVMEVLEYITELTDADFFIDDQKVVTFRSASK